MVSSISVEVVTARTTLFGELDNNAETQNHMSANQAAPQRITYFVPMKGFPLKLVTASSASYCQWRSVIVEIALLKVAICLGTFELDESKA